MTFPDRSIPDPYALKDVLADSEVLRVLQRQLASSKRCLQLVADILPPNLHAQLTAGPYDGETWTLLVSSGAVAAKLRYWQPEVEQHLKAYGVAVKKLQIKVSRT